MNLHIKIVAVLYIAPGSFGIVATLLAA